MHRENQGDTRKWLKDYPLDKFETETEREEKFNEFVKKSYQLVLDKVLADSDSLTDGNITVSGENNETPIIVDGKKIRANIEDLDNINKEDLENPFKKDEEKAELQVDISNVEIIPSNLIHSHAINKYKKKNPNAITQSEYNKIQSDPDYRVDLEKVIIIPKGLHRGHQINQYKKKNPNAITQQTYDRIKKKQLKFNKKDGVDEGVIKDKKKAKNK